MFVKIQNLSLESALLNHYLLLSQNLKTHNFVKQSKREFISNISFASCIKVNKHISGYEQVQQFSGIMLQIGDEIIASTEVDFCMLITDISFRSQ